MLDRTGLEHQRQGVSEPPVDVLDAFGGLAFVAHGGVDAGAQGAGHSEFQRG